MLYVILESFLFVTFYTLCVDGTVNKMLIYKPSSVNCKLSNISELEWKGMQLTVFEYLYMYSFL